MQKAGSGGSKLLGVKMDPETFENLLVEHTTRKITVSDLVRELTNDHQLQGAQAEGLQEQIRLLRGELKKL